MERLLVGASVRWAFGLLVVLTIRPELHWSLGWGEVTRRREIQLARVPLAAR
jgi:hypothetical protein